MSHTRVIEGWTLHYDAGNAHGMVTLTSPAEHDGTRERATVPMSVLVELVGSCIRDGEIAALEGLDGISYLKRLTRS